MPGACCIPNGLGFICGDGNVTQGDCAALNGRYYGGLTCSQVICGTVRCCQIDAEGAYTGECRDVPTCVSGINRGYGEKCGPNTCRVEPIRACCFIDGSCHLYTETECKSRGGVVRGELRCEDVRNGRGCEHPPHEEGCRHIHGDGHGPQLPSSTVDETYFKWSYDLCHAAFFEPIVRDRDNVDVDGGFARLQTLHPVRAVDTYLGDVNAPDAPTPNESCAFHYGDLDVGLDSFAEPYFCSQPFYSRDHNQTSLMAAVVQRVGLDKSEALADTFLGDGDSAFVGYYHAPYWTEAQFHSHIQICGEEV